MSRTPYGLWFPVVDPISVFSLLPKFGGYVSFLGYMLFSKHISSALRPHGHEQKPNVDSPFIPIQCFMILA